MKILGFVDVHADKKTLLALVQKAKDADVLISAGDLSIFGQGLEESLRLLLKAKKPIFLIPSNHEDAHMIEHAVRSHPLVKSLHKKIVNVGDVTFVGFGGGGFSLYEPEMEAFFKQAEKRLKIKKKIVFVTHAPPYNTTVDYLYWLGEHRGCKTTSNIIKHIQPALVLCGHFHETAYLEDLLGRTRIVNVGSEGTVLEI